MSERRQDIGDRLIKFSALTIKMLASIESDKASSHIAKQLLRSATSVGANYEEARAAESKADFIHKMQVSLKEMRESYYWFAVLVAAKIVDARKTSAIVEEARQLRAILAKAVATRKLTQGTRRSERSPYMADVKRQMSKVDVRGFLCGAIIS